jgi:hypothetical protein
MQNEDFSTLPDQEEGSGDEIRLFEKAQPMSSSFRANVPLVHKGIPSEIISDKVAGADDIF